MQISHQPLHHTTSIALNIVHLKTLKLIDYSFVDSDARDILKKLFLIGKEIGTVVCITMSAYKQENERNRARWTISKRLEQRPTREISVICRIIC